MWCMGKKDGGQHSVLLTTISGRATFLLLHVGSVNSACGRAWWGRLALARVTNAIGLDVFSNTGVSQQELDLGTI
jgi:hypothetical protein